ncbi:MAG: zinc ribbon domain-containing protein [Eubacteriaceae bacterium]|nr:zinc ribbon domain-containing protein [Eubacteriaceae bacterium]
MARYCPKCYESITSDMTQCPRCGSYLIQTPTSVTITETAIQQQVKPNNLIDDDQSEKDKQKIESVSPLNNPQIDSKEKELSQKEEVLQNNTVKKSDHNSKPKHEDSDIGPVIGLGEWVLTLLLLALPIVNIVMLIIWSATKETNPSKKNFARAQLIWYGIWIVLSIIIVGVVVSVALPFVMYSPGFGI